MDTPKVSVVVPAYNAEATIAATIEALLRQTYSGDLQIIVVDDGSKDHTAQIVQRYEKVCYIHQLNAGPASARNRGAADAVGEYIFFTDSDCRPEPGWVEKIIAGFTSSDIGVVAGSYGIANRFSWLSRVIHAEIIFRHCFLMPEFPKSFGSYNFSIRAELFRTLQGFNAGYRNASGEDNDLSYRLQAAGFKIRFLKDALVDHFHQEALGKYLREQFRHGFWRVRMYTDHFKMARGDDYTFWKDIIEVPLAFVSVGVIFSPDIFISVTTAFVLFEMIWGLVMARSLPEGILAGGVMWARSFFRTAGFSCGAFYFFISNKFTEKKN